MMMRLGVGLCAIGLGMGMLLPVAAGSAVESNPAESCAADLMANLDAQAEGEYPVPSITWEVAVQACRGERPDVMVYEDGSYAILDTDHEYPVYLGCLPGEACEINC